MNIKTFQILCETTISLYNYLGGINIGINMGIVKIGVSVFVAIAVTSLTFQYLVTTKKIKISKISKIFYDDDESFIKSWKKTQEKGMLKYIIKTIIYCWNGYNRHSFYIEQT